MYMTNSQHMNDTGDGDTGGGGDYKLRFPRYCRYRPHNDSSTLQPMFPFLDLNVLIILFVGSSFCYLFWLVILLLLWQFVLLVCLC